MQHITPVALLCALCAPLPARANDDTEAAYRSLLLNNAAAYDSLEITGENGASLDIGGYIMTRYVGAFSDGFGEEDAIVGFDQPRIRLGANGELNETFGFAMQVDYTGGAASLTDGYTTIGLDDGVKMYVGQYTQPYTREQDVSSTRQLAVERSIANSFFTADRSQGVMLEVARDSWRWKGSINDGMKEVNGEWNDPSEADFAFTTRLEYLAEGKWGQFKDYQGWRGGETGVLLGGALHYQTSGNTGATDGTTSVSSDLDDRLAFTLDASAEFNGANVMGGFYYQQRETSSGDFTDLGFVLQGGVMVGRQTELFARWDSILADSDRGDNDDVNTLTAGVSYFFVPESHAVRFTLDVQHVLSDLNDTPVGSSGKRTIQDSDDAQTALRAQVVLRF